MLAEERKSKIIEIVNKDRIVKVAELSKVLSTTEATVRRDLDELQKQKKIRRIHGGAISLKPTSKAFTENELLILCMEEKKKIAKKAYEFIDDNDAIIFDSSTTALELAKLIAEGNRKYLSIVTNSFNIVSILANKSDLRVLHTGGQILYNMNYAVGVITENMLRDLKVDKCFLGTNGIDPNYGYSVPTFEDASVKKCMLGAAKQRFVLADHTKFGESYMGKFAGFLGEVDYLITDSLPQKIDLELYEASVDLVVADQDE
ncbi:DeoR/GlpR family DNA-binding transcription regulator [Oscillospiraceae bacterium PP1C4]